MSGGLAMVASGCCHIQILSARCHESWGVVHFSPPGAEKAVGTLAHLSTGARDGHFCSFLSPVPLLL